MTTPLSILHESVKAVPAVKYALGVAGIASAIAIVQSFNLDPRVAIFGAIIMLLLMTLLIIFARLSSLATPDLRLPALVFMWFSLVFVIAIAFSMFLSVFFGWPLDLKEAIQPKPQSRENQMSNTDVPREREGLNKVMEKLKSATNFGGMTGVDTVFPESPTSNSACPEITIIDASKYPPESKIERRCIP